MRPDLIEEEKGWLLQVERDLDDVVFCLNGGRPSYMSPCSASI